MIPTFNKINLIDWLDNHLEEMFESLPFGVVRMNYQGVVTSYNTCESELFGISKENAIGKNFFVQVAPCTNNFMIAEKFQKDLLDEVLPYMFTYITKPTPVILRLLKGSKGNQYLLAKNA